MDTRYELVVDDSNQLSVLYELLKKRNHGISHSSMPSFSQHRKFVKSKPYRAWYIVVCSEIPVGTFYLSNENVVGINIKDDLIRDLLPNVMSYILKKYKPLQEIKSVRAARFICNIPPKNIILRDTFDQLNQELLQLTYSFE